MSSKHTYCIHYMNRIFKVEILMIFHLILNSIQTPFCFILIAASLFINIFRFLGPKGAKSGLYVLSIRCLIGQNLTLSWWKMVHSLRTDSLISWHTNDYVPFEIDRSTILKNHFCGMTSFSEKKKSSFVEFRWSWKTHTSSQKVELSSSIYRGISCENFREIFKFPEIIFSSYCK